MDPEETTVPGEGGEVDEPAATDGVGADAAGADGPETETVEAEVEPEAGETAPTATVVSTGPSAPVLFALFLVLTLVSMGGSALLLAGVGRSVQVEAPPAVPVIDRSGQAEAGPGGSERVRVLTATGRSTTLGSGDHQVTFVWTLEGARENDAAVIHFYAGNQFLGEQSGSLDASVFSFSSGTVTIVATLDCSTSGWSADLVTIRGVLVDGDGIAQVPGVDCR